MFSHSQISGVKPPLKIGFSFLSGKSIRFRASFYLVNETLISRGVKRPTSCLSAQGPTDVVANSKKKAYRWDFWSNCVLGFVVYRIGLCFSSDVCFWVLDRWLERSFVLFSAFWFVILVAFSALGFVGFVRTGIGSIKVAFAIQIIK